MTAGFVDAESMTETGPEAVRKAVNHKGAFAALWAKLTESDGPGQPARYPDAGATELPRAAEPVAAYGDEVQTEPPEPVLVVNLRERRVTYRGQEIRTKPPDNLQRQPLLALAVLQLIESVTGVGLRLNVEGACVLGLD